MQRTNFAWWNPFEVRTPFFVWNSILQSVISKPEEPLSGTPSTMPPSRTYPSRQ